jgi:hypothetical protein
MKMVETCKSSYRQYYLNCRCGLLISAGGCNATGRQGMYLEPIGHFFASRSEGWAGLFPLTNRQP